MSRTDRQQGFTLIEVLVVAPVMIMTIIIMMSFLFNQFGQLTQEGTRLRLVTDSQLITFSIQDDIFFASSFESDKNANLSDDYAPSGGWKSNTNPQTLIVSSVALTKSNRDPDRTPVYINTVGCDPSVLDQNSELLNNTIFFVSGTNLYKRILTAPSSLATCGTSHHKQTCPANNASSACPKDILLTDKLDSFSVTYFDSNNNTTTTPELAQKIKLSVQLKDRAFAEDVFGNSSITIKKVN